MMDCDTVFHIVQSGVSRSHFSEITLYLDSNDAGVPLPVPENQGDNSAPGAQVKDNIRGLRPHMVCQYDRINGKTISRCILYDLDITAKHAI